LNPACSQVTSFVLPYGLPEYLFDK
jgi:hypothetical protein